MERYNPDYEKKKEISLKGWVGKALSQLPKIKKVFFKDPTKKDRT